jgi:hypothetical protein
MTCFARAVVATALCLAAACAAPQPRAVADTFTASLQIHPDGRVDVQEDMTVRLGHGATVFERRITPIRADAVEFVSAAMDGRPLDRGAGVLDVDAGTSLRVRWTVAADAGTHEFSLRYQTANAIEIHGHRGHVRLTLLDAARQFDVRAATFSVLPPPGVSLEERSGMAEAGWTVARAAAGVSAERHDLAAADTATVAVELPIDPSVMKDPTWQMNEERATQFAPAFISGGLFILVVGVGILWIVRFEHPKRRTDDEAERRVVRRGLRLGGLACVVLSGAAAVVTWLFLAQYGLPPLVIPASIFIVGIIFLAIAGVIV